MKLKFIASLVLATTILAACGQDESEKTNDNVSAATDAVFDYKVDEFADVKILRYRIPDWEKLTLKEQTLVYCLTQAGLSGRDITWGQNYRHNLTIRKALESVYTNYTGDKTSNEWKAFEVYLKRVWFSNGINHHSSNDKIKPDFGVDYLKRLLTDTNTVLEGEAFDVVFNDKDTKKVNQGKGFDNVALSAVNFYGPNVTNNKVESFYKTKVSPNSKKPLSFGLNSQSVKENGVVKERVYKSGGLYGSAIDEIIKWLELAKGVAENKAQGDALGLLIDY